MLEGDRLKIEHVREASNIDLLHRVTASEIFPIVRELKTQTVFLMSTESLVDIIFFKCRS
jgi:hypothetical protein